jgi:hypothetical protein
LDLQEEDFDPLDEKERPLLQLDTGRDLPQVLADLQTFLTHRLEE